MSKWYKHVWLYSSVSVFLLTGCIDTVAQYGSYWQAERYNSAINSMPINAPSMRNRYYIIPATNEVEGREHLGIDIIATANTPVLAAAGGTVINSFFEPMYGNNVVIDHGVDESGRRIRTQYKHLQTRLVQQGDVVVRGQQIGGLGRTGVLAAAVLHLHFEFQRGSNRGVLAPIDPNEYWVNGSGMVTCFDETAEYPEEPFRITYPVVCR